MSDYRIQLDVYHGPLDLLLYLIKRDEIDIYDIPVHHVTEQYLQHVQTIKALDMDLAAEFMVMAATLVEIKSAMMAIAQAAADAEQVDEETTAVEDPTDPRFELVQQLLAYKRFKDAAMELDRRRAEFASRYPRHPAKFKPDQGDDNGPPELDLEDVSVWDLLEMFTSLMEQVGGPPLHSVTVDDTPIELHAADIVDRIERDGAMTLQAMFVGRYSVQEKLGLFLALLELLRQRKVRVQQDRIAGDIYINLIPRAERVAENDDAPSNLQYDPNNPDNFDWPDADEYKRYARRIERRLKGESVEEDEELEEELKALEAEEAGEIEAVTAADSTEEVAEEASHDDESAER